jgi:hypothetical protein
MDTVIIARKMRQNKETKEIEGCFAKNDFL